MSLGCLNEFGMSGFWQTCVVSLLYTYCTGIVHYTLKAFPNLYVTAGSFISI